MNVLAKSLMKGRRYTLGLTGVLLVVIIAACGKGKDVECPVARPGGDTAERPAEHPDGEKELTKEELAAAITGYVREETELKGGFFLVYDPEAEKTLALSLVKVHEENLATLGDGVYFACADFASTEGPVYDLDVFMKRGGGGLDVTRITVHKEDGEPRYDWAEEDGLWKMVPVAE